jgi:hypothetical protein
MLSTYHVFFALGGKMATNNPAHCTRMGIWQTFCGGASSFKFWSNNSGNRA